MFYKKPPNVSYVDMAIYIDTHKNDKERNDNLMFEYMWHLFYILAVKRRFFNTDRDYNEYALYAATRLFMRYKREREGTSKRLKPIKSSLNYIKKVLYPMKVDYQQSYFEEVVREDKAKDSAQHQLYEDKVDSIRKSNNELLRVEYTYYLDSICNTIRFTLNRIPYKNNNLMMHNIYLSCVLTLLKTVTLSNENKNKLAARIDKALPIEVMIDSLYKQESQDNVVLYHLDRSMKNYIMTLVAIIRKEIVKDLRGIIGSYEPSEQVIKDILMSPMKEYVNTDEQQ